MNNRSIQNLVPSDIAFKIASLLQELDLCALGSCSRFWRELCGSDHIWAGLCRDRWPALGFVKEQSSSVPEFNPHQLQQQHLDSNLKGWRGFYVNKHHEMASKADAVIAFLEQCISSESVEVNHYLVAMQNMNSMQFGFRDVVLFFFKENLHVLLNLAGLHYCIAWLGVPADDVMEALSSSKICDRQICVQWWKLGRWLYGFRLRDESISRRASLRDLAMMKEQQILDVLHRVPFMRSYVFRFQLLNPFPLLGHAKHQVRECVYVHVYIMHCVHNCLDICQIVNKWHCVHQFA